MHHILDQKNVRFPHCPLSENDKSPLLHSSHRRVSAVKGGAYMAFILGIYLTTNANRVCACLGSMRNFHGAYTPRSIGVHTPLTVDNQCISKNRSMNCSQLACWCLSSAYFFFAETKARVWVYTLEAGKVPHSALHCKDRGKETGKTGNAEEGCEEWKGSVLAGGQQPFGATASEGQGFVHCEPSSRAL